MFNDKSIKSVGIAGVLQEILLLGLVILSVIWLVIGNPFTSLKKEIANTVSNNLKEIKAYKQELLDEFNGAYPESITPNGKVVEYTLIASEGEVAIIDNIKTRVWNYNGQVPGPILRVKLGETIRVKFTNKLPQETTIHWHGVRVPNAMDGVPGVTQPPIKPGESFTYEFTPKDPGTFWFHPHVRGSEQLERGLYGVLIVEDEYSQKYNQDIALVVDDWLLQNNWQIDPNFVTPMDLMHDGRWGNVITVNSKLQFTQEVKAGERIRLRFVNASNARVYRLYFPKKLNPIAIAVDGMYVRKLFDPNGFDLAPGNRLDVDITIPKNAKPGDVFKITDQFTRKTNVLATLKVVEGKVKTPDFKPPANPKVPVWEKAQYIPNDKSYVLDAIIIRRPGMGRGMGSGRNMGPEIKWTINGKAYPDYEPFTFKYGTFNKFIFENKSPRLHPMHLHGQFFKVVKRNGKVVDEGFFRDTVLVYPRESVEVALVPLDKGRWLNHCHIQEHADAGMMTVVEVE